MNWVTLLELFGVVVAAIALVSFVVKLWLMHEEAGEIIREEEEDR